VAFLIQDSDKARISGLAECAKAVNKTNLGRRLQMLTCMKPRLFRLQKSTNESAWGMGVMLGAAGPGLTSTSPEEQSRIRVRLRAIRTQPEKDWPPLRAWFLSRFLPRVLPF
jgi:hypothetical protein